MVHGFDYGVKVAQDEYGLTLEHLSLSGQKIAGISNAGNILAIHDLTSVNTIPAIRSDRTGFVSLVDARLTGGTSDFSAVQTSGELMARRLTTSGYRSAVTAGTRIVSGASLAEYLSKPAVHPYPQSPSGAADLEIRDTPQANPGDPSTWASVVAYGAKPDDATDDTAAFQKALDAGRPVVYLPTGRYVISGTLHVKGAVRELLGFGSLITPAGTAFTKVTSPTPLVQVDDGSAPDVTVADLTVARAAVNPAKTAGLVGFAQHTRRPLVLKDIGCCGTYQAGYRAAPGAGPLYLEDVSVSGWHFDQPQQVWARQFNNVDERLSTPTGTTAHTPRLVNSDATLWVLGFESEQSGPVVGTDGSGRTEILGGAVYEADSSTDTAFTCADHGSMALSFATMGTGVGGYHDLVRESRSGITRNLPRAQGAWRGDGRSVPLYAG